MRTLLLLTALLIAQDPASRLAALTAHQDADRGDPDRLYADRARLPSALEAARIWEQRLEGEGSDFESAWKLARACYWLGGHVPDSERRQQYERGIEAGRHAAALEPERPEGHFWMAANMGAMAESFGIRAGLRYRGDIRRELEAVLAIDPSFQQGSADRALGRWYLRVPRLLGGSTDKSVEHLQRSLTYDPGSAASHFFLAETFLKMNRREEAYDELRRVLASPLRAEWVPETLEFQEKARLLLNELGTP